MVYVWCLLLVLLDEQIDMPSFTPNYSNAKENGFNKRIYKHSGFHV
jgi:hypothetical protein